MKKLVKKLVMEGPEKSMLTEVEMPQITKPNQVLVKLKYCGVCMSEHFAWSTAEAGMSFGHEPVGVVVEVGTKVTRVKPGDRVSGLFSGSAEYDVTEEENVFVIPEGIRDEEAILEPLSCLISAVSKVKIPVIGEKVAVVGCGYMGCGAISLLKMRGAHVVAVDIKRESLVNALTYGADEAYIPDELPEQYVNVVREDKTTGFSLVMEWGETEEALDLAIRMTRYCGQLAIGAYHTGGKRLVDVQCLNVRAIDCLSTHPREEELNRECCKNAVKLLAEGWNFKSVPTKLYPITQFDAAQGELPEKFGKWMKSVVDWTKFEGEPYIIE